jgi:hypothetical protein
MRSVLAVLLMLGGVVACSSSAALPNGPSPKGPSTAVQDTLPSATLLRRLAEAADGYRDGEPRYVAADRIFRPDARGHKVAGVFLTREEAAAAADKANNAESGAEYRVFGPYRTMPDSLAEGPEDVVSVTVLMKNGRTKTYSADTVDALFWSLPAFDKFVAPYLTSVAGPRYAWEQREFFRRGRSPLANSQVVPHYRGSL